MPTKWNTFTNNFDLVNSTSSTVLGPGSATDNAVVRFDGTTGKLIQNSGATLSDADVLSVAEINLTTDLAVQYGGTGTGSLTGVLTGNGTAAISANTVTQYGVLVGGASNAVDSTAVGVAGEVLTSGGPGVAPSFGVAGTGDVTAALAIADNTIVRGDGGVKGIQASGITISDADAVTGMASLDLAVGGAYSINSTSVLNATTLGAAVVNSSLTSVGTLATGTWEATDIGVLHGGSGRSTGGVAYSVLCAGTTATGIQQNVAALGAASTVLTSNGAGALPSFQVVAGGGNVTKVGTPVDNQIGVWTGDGTIEGTADFTFDGADLLFYNAANDGNPEIRLGATDLEELHMQAVYDGAAQTLDYVLFQTDVASATANKGLFRFNVDGANVLDIDDGGIDLDTGGALSINGTDVLDATTLGSAVVNSSLTSVGTIATGTWSATDIAVAAGGTGRSSHTAYAVICGGTGATTAQQSIASVGTAAQVLTSNGAGALPTFQAAAGGGLTWSTVTDATKAMAVNEGYVASRATDITFTLPDTAAVGDIVRIVDNGTGGNIVVAQNAGETIHIVGSSTTTGVGGSLTSTELYDTIELICITANTDWIVGAVTGNYTIV